MSSAKNNEQTIDLGALEAQAAAVDAKVAEETAPPQVEPAPSAGASVSPEEFWKKGLQSAFDNGCQIAAPFWWKNGFGNVTPKMAEAWSHVIVATPWMQRWLEVLLKSSGPWSAAIIITYVSVKPFMDMPRVEKNVEAAKEKTAQATPPTAPVDGAH